MDQQCRSVKVVSCINTAPRSVVHHMQSFPLAIQRSRYYLLCSAPGRSTPCLGSLLHIKTSAILVLPVSLEDFFSLRALSVRIIFYGMRRPLMEEYLESGNKSWRSEAVLNIPSVSIPSMLRFDVKQPMDIEDASPPAARL